jgi:hypothetical protein
MPRKAPQRDDPAQSKRFIEMARAVEATDDPEAFARMLKQIVNSGPKPRPVTKKRQRGAKGA